MRRNLLSQSLVRFGADFHLSLRPLSSRPRTVAIPRKVRRRFPHFLEEKADESRTDVAIPRKVRRRFPLNPRPIFCRDSTLMSQSLVRFGADFHNEKDVLKAALQIGRNPS